MSEEQQYDEQLQVLSELLPREHQDRLTCLSHQHDDGVNRVRLYLYLCKDSPRTPPNAGEWRLPNS
jgi:hypothetical protein